MSDRKPLSKADIAYIKKLQKEGNPTTGDYLMEALHRQGLEVPAELVSYYNPAPVDESFNKFLSSANISPDEDLAIYFKQKWDQENNKPYIKQHKSNKDIKDTITLGRRVAHPDTLHIPEGDIDAFYEGTHFDDSLDWEKHYKRIKKERESSKGLLQKAKDYFGY